MVSLLEKKVIAILGANGQIGRTLIGIYGQLDIELYLFVRNHDTLADLSFNTFIHVLPYDAFGREHYDVVINAAGPGDPVIQRKLNSRIVETLDRLDLLVLNYIDDHSDTIYIYISSGAVYDGNYVNAVDNLSVFSLPAGKLDEICMYPLAKLAAEARHRARFNARIADIRLFGYVSEYLNPEAGHFLSQILRALRENVPFETHCVDFVRDVVGPAELTDLIERIVEAGGKNEAYDLYSVAPMTKLELLDQMSHIYGLKVSFSHEVTANMGARKPDRITLRDQAELIFYLPKRTSIDVVVEEFKKAMTHFQSEAVI